MSYIAQTKRILDGIDLICGTRRKRLIYVSYNGLNIGGTVLRHELTNWIKVLPEVSDRFLDRR